MAWVLFAQQNTVKSANLNSIINFYFVTGFYRFDNICITDRKITLHQSSDFNITEIRTAFCVLSLIRNLSSIRSFTNHAILPLESQRTSCARFSKAFFFLSVR